MPLSPSEKTTIETAISECIDDISPNTPAADFLNLTLALNSILTALELLSLPNPLPNPPPPFLPSQMLMKIEEFKKYLHILSILPDGKDRLDFARERIEEKIAAITRTMTLQSVSSAPPLPVLLRLPQWKLIEEIRRPDQQTLVYRKNTNIPAIISQISLSTLSPPTLLCYSQRRHTVSLKSSIVNFPKIINLGVELGVELFISRSINVFSFEVTFTFSYGDTSALDPFLAQIIKIDPSVDEISPKIFFEYRERCGFSKTPSPSTGLSTSQRPFTDPPEYLIELNNPENQYVDRFIAFNILIQKAQRNGASESKDRAQGQLNDLLEQAKREFKRQFPGKPQPR